MSIIKKILENIPSNKNVPRLKKNIVNNNQDLAVVIHTCDAYSFCWEAWY